MDISSLKMTDSNYKINVSYPRSNRYVFYYPCKDSSKCSSYSFFLNPGKYKFKVYGASAGNIVSTMRSSDRSTCITTQDEVQKYLDQHTLM